MLSGARLPTALFGFRENVANRVSNPLQVGSVPYKMTLNTVSIVGVGLIGGSFALALRKAGFDGRIIGVSSGQTVRAALEQGVIDEAQPLDQSAAISDLIYLAQPIERILKTLETIDAYLRPGTLVTDAGSTKRTIVETASQHIRRGIFLGGHPMAGKESRGVQEADPDLFRGRPYVLTSRNPLLESWIERIGARLVFLDAAEHDRLVALTSHLPQLLSTALANLIGREKSAAEVAGPAALDLTRLAASPYEIWHDIFATNAEPIDHALAAFIEKMEKIRASLASPQMAREFEAAAEASRTLRRQI